MNDTRQDNIFDKIHKGMEVYDPAGNKLGIVHYVHHGDTYAGDMEVKIETSNDEDTLLDMMSRNEQDPSTVAEELKDRLLHEGYIRIGDGEQGSNYCATIYQLEGIHDGKLQLIVTSDQLVQF